MALLPELLLLQRLGDSEFDSGTPPSPANWRTTEYPLRARAAKTIGLVVKVARGGPKGVCSEDAFCDEISVVDQ